MLNIWLTIIVIVFMLYILRLVAKKLVEMRNVISWLILCIVSLPVIWFPNLIGAISEFFGIQILSNFVFLLSTFLLIFLIFSLTRTVSNQSVQIKKLSQTIALLRSENKNEQ